MKRHINKIAKTICLLVMGGYLSAGALAPQQKQAEPPLLTEINRVQLQMEDEVFACIESSALLPNGDVVLMINASNYNDQYSILKFDRTGRMTAKYNSRGYGPGQLGSMANIIATKDHILAAEATTPFVHIFDHNLKFLKDHRIKVQGKIFDLGKYYGIWYPTLKVENNKNITYVLSLYKRDNFEFQGYAYQIKERPDHVSLWGGIAHVADNVIAASFSNEYQIKLFNSDLTHSKNLLKTIPEHIIQYHPYKGSPNKFDNSSLKWMKSWSIVANLFYANEKYVLAHRLNDKTYLDIYDKNGKALKLNHYYKHAHALFANTGDIFYRTDQKKNNEDDDENQAVFVVKEKLNI